MGRIPPNKPAGYQNELFCSIKGVSLMQPAGFCGGTPFSLRRRVGAEAKPRACSSKARQDEVVAVTP